MNVAIQQMLVTIDFYSVDRKENIYQNIFYVFFGVN